MFAKKGEILSIWSHWIVEPPASSQSNSMHQYAIISVTKDALLRQIMISLAASFASSTLIFVEALCTISTISNF